MWRMGLWTQQGRRGWDELGAQHDMRAPPCVTQIASGKCPKTRDRAPCSVMTWSVGWRGRREGGGDGRREGGSRGGDMCILRAVSHCAAETNNSVIILPLKTLKKL